MSQFLGVDIGGTASRFVLVDDAGIVLLRGAVGGATGHVFNPVERQKLQAVLEAIAADIAPHGALGGVHLGITGLGDAARAEAADLIATVLGLPVAGVSLSDDMELAYRAAFAPGEGHLISAGTGSIGLHVEAGGDIIRVGGRGIMIDDGGSGTWIALTALDRLYRLIDETGTPAGADVLAEELFAAMGGAEWDATRSYVYGSDRGRVGALATAVARAADRGDALASEILRQAGRELARLAQALIQRTQKLPVGYVGGILRLHPFIIASLIETLADVTVVFPQLDAAEYAATIARSA